MITCILFCDHAIRFWQELLPCFVCNPKVLIVPRVCLNFHRCSRIVCYILYNVDHLWHTFLINLYLLLYCRVVIKHSAARTVCCSINGATIHNTSSATSAAGSSRNLVCWTITGLHIPLSGATRVYTAHKSSIICGHLSNTWHVITHIVLKKWKKSLRLYCMHARCVQKCSMRRKTMWHTCIDTKE